MYTIFCLPIYLRWIFDLLAIVNNAIMNMSVHTLV